MSNKTPYYSCQWSFNSVIGVIETSPNCWWSSELNCSHTAAPRLEMKYLWLSESFFGGTHLACNLGYRRFHFVLHYTFQNFLNTWRLQKGRAMLTIGCSHSPLRQWRDYRLCAKRKPSLILPSRIKSHTTEKLKYSVKDLAVKNYCCNLPNFTFH